MCDADDINLNRLALSRWHPDFEAESARLPIEPFQGSVRQVVLLSG
jgi:hypothetical protein